MKIHFCDLCNESVPQSDLDQGRARLVKGRVVCSSCERAMSLAAASGGAPPYAHPGDTALHTPMTSATIPQAPPPPAAAPAGQAGIAPAVPSAAGSGSSAVWMAAASLLLTGVVVYVFQQRVERLEAADTELARGIEQSNADARALGGQLARLPAQSAEIEQRLTQKLEAALATSERQRGELATATQRAEQALAELQRALTDLRRDLDSGALTREQRLDEISHRLAQSEDARRELDGRLSEYQKSAESARAVAEAAAKALPEKPAAAPAGPTWGALLPNLADANPSTRWEAVDELGRTKEPAVISHLLPLLKDSDLFVRMCVARVLADLGTLQGVPALIDALEDGEPTVRESAWNALRTLTGKDFKYDPQGNDADRQKKVKTWREWWKKEGEALQGGGAPPDGKQPAIGKPGTH